MALINLKTNLKSLKYGLDRPDLGSSKQPFITKPIPEDRLVNSPDFLLRQNAIGRGLSDVGRISKFLTTPQGLGFIANQNLLAAQNPKIPGNPKNLYLPTSTLAQLPLNAEGGHLNFLGVNPFDNSGKYFEVYKRDYSDRRSNRLSILQQQKIGVKYESSPNMGASAILEQGIALGPYNILNYLGGPNAGKNGLNTTIKRTEFTVGSNGYTGPSIQNSLNRALQQIASSKTYFNSNSPSGSVSEITYGAGSANTLASPESIKSSKEKSQIKISEAKTYFNSNSPSGSSSEVTYGAASDNKVVTLKTAYKKGTRASEIENYNPDPWFTSSSYKAGSDIPEDKFNKDITNRLNNSPITNNKDLESEQLIKFHINLINADSPQTNNYLFFQAYIDSFSDTIGSDYEQYSYVGRGYPFFKYKGFTKEISLSFTIAAHNPTQMLSIYEKLNTLQQHLAPNYSNAGYLRGNFVKLTFGDYLINTPGILKGFSLTPEFDGGFDIGGNVDNTSGKQLPKVIKVGNFAFTPIADNNNNYMSSNSRFISNTSLLKN